MRHRCKPSVRVGRFDIFVWSCLVHLSMGMKVTLDSLPTGLCMHSRVQPSLNGLPCHIRGMEDVLSTHHPYY